MAEKKDIWSLLQQADAKKLIEDIDRLAHDNDITRFSRVAGVQALMKRFKERWPT